ncbi:hypothetical protein GCM10018966_067740 [Streptomyces yanii]
MTRNPDRDDHLPIYEGLVRECGDVLAEAHRASQQALHQAAALIGPEAVQSEPQRQRQGFTA